MARATLNYVLPDEFDDFRDALQGASVRLVVLGLDQYLRNRVKYEQLPLPVAEALQTAREELRDLCEEHRVSLDD